MLWFCCCLGVLCLWCCFVIPTRRRRICCWVGSRQAFSLRAKRRIRHEVPFAFLRHPIKIGTVMSDHLVNPYVEQGAVVRRFQNTGGNPVDAKRMKELLFGSEQPQGVVLTTLDNVVNWMRKSSICL